MEKIPHQAGRGPSSMSAVSAPQNPRAEQRHRGSDHNARPRTEGQHLIHDLIIGQQHIDTRVFIWNEKHVMRMMDDLEDEISRLQPSGIPIPETASSDNIVQPLYNRVENGRLQDLSRPTGRWKSQSCENQPWHCIELVSDTAVGESRAKGLAKMDAKRESDADEMWSNKASAGVGCNDT